ncbi:MAG TPA: hypothetical protein VIV66_04915 [Pyrinomonadaceae bacterium]
MSDGPVVVSYKELAEIIVRERGIHEGFWGAYVRFGLNAGNVNFALPDGSTTSVVPTAMIPILELGIQRFPEEHELTVDASKVNPKPRGKRGGKPSPTKARKK